MPSRGSPPARERCSARARSARPNEWSRPSLLARRRSGRGRGGGRRTRAYPLHLDRPRRPRLASRTRVRGVRRSGLDRPSRNPHHRRTHPKGHRMNRSPRLLGVATTAAAVILAVAACSSSAAPSPAADGPVTITFSVVQLRHAGRCRYRHPGAARPLRRGAPRDHGGSAGRAHRRRAHQGQDRRRGGAVLPMSCRSATASSPRHSRPCRCVAEDHRRRRVGPHVEGIKQALRRRPGRTRARSRRCRTRSRSRPCSTTPICSARRAWTR